MSEREVQADCPECGPYGGSKPLIRGATQVYVQCEVHGLVGLRKEASTDDRVGSS